VTDPESLDLKWTEPDEEGLIQFLAREKAFSEDRVRKGIEKLKKNRQTSVQGRLTSFFTAKPAKATAAKKEEPSDDDMDVDFGIHKSDEENEDADDEPTTASVKPEKASSSPAKKSADTKPHAVPVKPDPVVADAKPVKSWGDIFGKKLGGSSSPAKKSEEAKPHTASPSKVPIKPDPAEDDVEEATTIKPDPVPSTETPAAQSPPKRAAVAKRKRIVEDDDEEDDATTAAAKKTKSSE
jgi:hypothetical protein